jgi:hypothetical protein
MCRHRRVIGDMCVRKMRFGLFNFELCSVQNVIIQSSVEVVGGLNLRNASTGIEI